MPASSSRASTSTTRPGCASGAPSRQPDGPTPYPPGSSERRCSYAERLELQGLGGTHGAGAGEREANVNYRHVGSPGPSLATGQMFPTMKRPKRWRGERAESTCGCTLRRQPWSRRWTGRSLRLRHGGWRPGSSSGAGGSMPPTPGPDRGAVPPRSAVGVPIHRRRARRRGSAGAGGRGPGAPHRPAAHRIQAARRQDLGDLADEAHFRAARGNWCGASGC